MKQNVSSCNIGLHANPCSWYIWLHKINCVFDSNAIFSFAATMLFENWWKHLISIKNECLALKSSGVSFTCPFKHLKKN